MPSLSPGATVPGTATPATATPAAPGPQAAATPATATPQASSGSGTASPQSANTSASLPSAQNPTPVPESLGRSFRGISLGMSVDELKKVLRADDIFNFRGDRDVSMLPEQDQTLIETTGLSFIRRSFFQFWQGKLCIMAFTMDPAKVDYYSIFTTLTAKYGDPGELDPQQAVWTSDETRLSLERPLTVKYIDKKMFDALLGASKVKETQDTVLRGEFLHGF